MLVNPYRMACSEYDPIKSIIPYGFASLRIWQFRLIVGCGAGDGGWLETCQPDNKRLVS